MKYKHWFVGIGLGTAIGLIVAAAATFLDWRLNPGGIFEEAGHTNWFIVWDTGISWFVPVSAIVTVSSLLVLYIVSRRK